jgi:hypothetical protein
MVWQVIPVAAFPLRQGIAHAAAAIGEEVQAERAARLLGAAMALRERVGVPQGPQRRADVDRAAASLREALGEERWAAAFAAGQALALEEAVQEALGDAESAVG